MLPGGGLDALLIAVSILYALAVARSGHPTAQRQIVWFGAGISTALLIVSGPIERLALNRMFTAYIFQQFTLIMVAAPMILAGIPDWMLRPVFRSRIGGPTMRFATKPLVAFLTFAMVFSLIHYPSLCDQVCHVRPTYYTIRILLLLVGMLLWFPLGSPLPEIPRLSYPAQILYIFMLMIPMTAVAAPVTLADSVLYDFYLPGPHPFGMTPMEDQIIGGLFMWIGQGIYLMGVATCFFIWWYRTDSDEAPLVKDSRSARLYRV